MLKIILTPAHTVALLAPMAACSDIKGAIEFSENRDEFADRVERRDNRYLTTVTSVPGSGSTTSKGEATLAAGSKDEGVALIGDATLTIH